MPQPIRPTVTHLLDHADELREGPVELVEDAVEEAGRHIGTLPQQLRHVLLKQGRGAGLCGGKGRQHHWGLQSRTPACPVYLCPHLLGHWCKDQKLPENSQVMKARGQGPALCGV